MGFRIDDRATQRYDDPTGQTSTPLTEQQQQKFQGAIEDALEARADRGGPGELRETQERVFVVEPGDSFARIAEENDVSYRELLDFNRRSDIPNPDRIDPGDVVFVPNTSPEEAAASPVDENGVPEGEAIFAGNLYDRGNALEYADDPAAIDYEKETQDLATGVRTYLQALPADQRQDAALRLVTRDWRDAGPAQSAVEQAVEAEGLSTDPEAVTAQRLYDRGNALEYADDPSSVDYDAEIDALAGTVRDYLELLPQGNRQDALQRLYDRDWRDAGPAQVAIEQVARTEGITLAPTTHAGADVEASARRITDTAATESDPAAALEALNEGYAGASPEVQQVLLRNLAAQAIFTDAADWAAEPLNGDPDREQPQFMVAETMRRLEGLTEGTDPAVAAKLFTEMLPKFETANERLLDYGGVQAGPSGTMSLMTVFDRIAGTPEGDAAISRFAEQPYAVNMDTVIYAISQGMNPAYAIDLAAQGGMVDNFVNDYVLSPVEQFRDGLIGEQAEDYLEHIEELSYLIANGGAAMTEDQLNAAINDYVQAKGPEWEQRLEQLQTQLGDSGAKLLTQIQELQNMPDDLRADHQEEINGLLDDPNAQLAVSMALQQHPELVRGAAGRELVETFAELGITGADNPLAVNLAGAYLRENVIAPAGAIDPNDPSSLRDARTRLTEALKDNPQLATMLGVTPDQLNEVADAFIELVPQHTSEFNPERYGIDAARNLNNALDKADEIFRDTPFNRGFRVGALAIVGSGLSNAVEAYGDHPSLRNALQVAVDSARVGIDGAQLVTSLFNPSTDSGLTNGLKLGGKFVHLLGAGLAGIDALARLGRGDILGAGLNAAVAGGVGYAVFGSSTLAGPIGFGIATAATLGLFVWDGIQNASHNSRFETGTTADFLRHAGFSEEAAQALIDQSGESYSPVPILMRYGELHGLTPEQTVAWVNSIASSEDGPAKLDALRDNLHHTLDEIDGNVSEFNATADNDAERIWDTEQRPWFARTGEARPESAAQLDAMLPILEIEVPVTPA
ncbi:MAG: LysM peptidoglycan-binding domain-containing protein [Rhizobiales bacterium]|nr:LysM peptidoglycan-binding domain-containing protein [Hyphomicrobiales bacterium]